MRYLRVIATFLVMSGMALGLDTVSKDLVFTSVERTIDLQSQLVKINTKLTLSNGGQGAVKSFHYVVEESFKDNVAYIGATVRYNIICMFFSLIYQFYCSLEPATRLI